MPRLDRKRFSNDLPQFAEIAAMLPGDDLPDPWDRDKLVDRWEQQLLDLEDRFSSRFPTSQSDLNDACKGGSFVIRSAAVETTDGIIGVPSGPTRRAIESALFPDLRDTTRAISKAGTLRISGGPFVLADCFALFEIAHFSKFLLDAIVSHEAHLKGGGHATVPAPGAVLRLAPGRPIGRPTPVAHLQLVLDAIAETHPDQIRRCPRCSIVFVATRNNAGGCSPRCCKWVRVQRFRDRQAREQRDEAVQLALAPETMDTEPLVRQRRRRAQRRAEKRRASTTQRQET